MRIAIVVYRGAAVSLPFSAGGSRGGGVSCTALFCARAWSHVGLREAALGCYLCSARRSGFFFTQLKSSVSRH